MYYPDMIEYIRFLFLMLDAFSATQEKVSKSGRPQTYSDASLIVFYAVMTLKGITAMRAQQTYLFHHPLLLERCRLPACPTHVTLGRRYKALTPKLQAFTEYIAASRFATEAGFFKRSFMKIKACSKLRDPSGIRRIVSTIISRKTCEVLIKPATWSKSGYHGWVYGYGLHLTVSAMDFQ